MSLSDGERLTGLYHSLHRLTNLRIRLSEEMNRRNVDKNVLREMESLLNGLWHDFLGRQSNGAHWILGSPSTRKLTYDSEASSPWAVALRAGAPKASAVYDWEPGKTLTWTPDPEEGLEAMEDFNPLKDRLNIPNFLREFRSWYDGPIDSVVYEIYRELETTVYFLRRYKDKLLSQYENLDRAVSALFGLCFCHMLGTESFSKAYILTEVCKILYGREYFFKSQAGQFDAVTRWALTTNFQHHIPHVMNDWPIEKLADLHVRLLGRKPENQLLERLLGFLQLAGRKLHYEHQHNEVLAMCKKTPELKTKKALAAVRAALKNCSDEHAQREKESKDKSDDDSKLDDVAIY